MSPLTPVVLFAYNRPLHVQRTLESLARCSRREDCRLTVYCDGPKPGDPDSEVEAARSVVREWAPRLAARIVERPANLGLAQSVVTGVTEACRQQGRVIVLEDDLIVSPDFLEYMLEALDRYQDNPSVYQVSGYMYPIRHPRGPDAFFLPLTTSWGWATWARAWSAFQWNPPDAPTLLADPAFRRRFDLNHSYRYADLLERRLAGRSQSWGILWWFAVFMANGWILYPRQSLIWNGGFDDTGTHDGAAGPIRSVDPNLFTHPRLSQPIRFPDVAAVDDAAFQRVLRFFRFQWGTSRLFQRRALYWLNRLKQRSQRFLCGRNEEP